MAGTVLKGITQSLTAASLTGNALTGIIQFYTNTTSTSVVSAFANARAIEAYITGYEHSNRLQGVK